MTSSTERMIAEKDGAIGWMVFNNPLRHNAVSTDMWQAVPEILDAFENDDAIRVIVLTGAGEKAFVAGADISQFEETRSSPEKVQEYEDMTASAFERIAACTKPTIAMIDGYCIGGGLGIALSCDLRYAAEGSTFGIPAARLGLAYPLGQTRRLVNLVGPARSKEIFFTAKRYGAEEALAMGLINQLFSKEDLREHVLATCTSIADNAPLTVASEKQIVDEIGKAPGNFDAVYCNRLIGRCFASEDYAEGRTAFMEKRRPRFRGR